MASKASVESKIVEFFNSAEFGKVESVFGIVRGIVKRRSGEKESTGSVVVAPIKRRAARKKKDPTPAVAAPERPTTLV